MQQTMYQSLRLLQPRNIMFGFPLELVPAVSRYKFKDLLCGRHKESMCLRPCHFLQLSYPQLVLFCVLHHPGIPLLTSQLTGCFWHQEYLPSLLLKLFPSWSFALIFVFLLLFRESLATVIRDWPTVRIDHDNLSIRTNNRLPVNPQHGTCGHLGSWTSVFPPQLLPV